MYTGEMFEADDVDAVMAAHRVAGSPADLRAAWLAHVGETLAAGTLTMPAPESWMQKGGKQGRHSENLGYVLAEMQFLQRAYPGAQW
jgi:ring-1,2-phenylacetyl-CoA epoxidase subunit PaaC